MSAAVALSMAPEIRERVHPRVEAGFMVKLLLPENTVVARARDLSMAGLLLDGGYTAESGRITISLPLPRDREIVATCSIRRLDADGTALEFEQLDWDDLLALARYLHPRLP